jgi:ABC-2 type transport system ATP-binding protein
LAEEKLKNLIEQGEKILSYEKHDRSIEEILIDYYKGERNV